MGDRARAELLLSCVRQAVDPLAGSLPAGSLPASAPDWEWFFALASRHRVLPAVVRRLLRGDLRLEPAVVSKLEALDRSNERFGESLQRTMLRGLDAIASTSVRAMPWAGRAFANSTAGKRVPRQHWGVDLFVDPRGVGRAIAALESSGLRPWRARPARHIDTWRKLENHETFIDSSSGHVVRIHWNVLREVYRACPTAWG